NCFESLTSFMAGYASFCFARLLIHEAERGRRRLLPDGKNLLQVVLCRLQLGFLLFHEGAIFIERGLHLGLGSVVVHGLLQFFRFGAGRAEETTATLTVAAAIAALIAI